MSEAISMNTPKRKFNPWPWGIGLFLSVVVGVNLYVVFLSQQNAPTLADQDYYEKGLAFEQTLEARRASAALGWRSEVTVCPSGRADGRCEVAFRLKDADGRPLAGLSGQLIAQRANDASIDAKATFKDMGQGLYVADLAIAKAGYWHLNTTFTGQGETPWLDARKVKVEDARP